MPKSEPDLFAEKMDSLQNVASGEETIRAQFPDCVLTITLVKEHHTHYRVRIEGQEVARVEFAGDPLFWKILQDSNVESRVATIRDALVVLAVEYRHLGKTLPALGESWQRVLDNSESLNGELDHLLKALEPRKGPLPIPTAFGLRSATGTCVTCRGVTSFEDGTLESPEGSDPLCESETGRIAYFCETHRPWTFWKTPQPRYLMVFAGNSEEYLNWLETQPRSVRDRAFEVAALYDLPEEPFDFTWIGTFWRVQNDRKAEAYSACSGPFKGTFIPPSKLFLPPSQRT